MPTPPVRDVTAAPHPEPTAARATVAAPEPEAAAEQVELRIGGMTCASCAARVQKKLNRLDGVVATVNYATEKATVSYRAPHSPEDLVAEVEQAGYTAELPDPLAASGPAGPSGAAPGSGPDREPPVRLLVSAGLTLPVIVLSMVPAWQFVNWQWLSLALSAPVVVWGALPLHRAAWTNARQGTATMDTLVSTGVLAATGRSARSRAGLSSRVLGSVPARRGT